MNHHPVGTRLFTLVVLVTTITFAASSNAAAASAPPNDVIENATVVDRVPFSVTQNDTVDSTKAGEPAPSCFSGEYGTVWFRYDPPADALLRVRVEGATVVLYEGAPGALHELSCGAPMEPVAFRGGTTYYFMVATFFGLGPPRPVTFSLESPSPPANDLIESATVVDRAPFTVTQNDTRDATRVGEPAPSCLGGAYGSVWFRYDAPADAWLRVRGSSVIYQGLPEALREVACGQQLQPVAFRGGTTYYFMVATPSGVILPVTFSLELASPPANDLIENATVVDSVPFAVTQNDTVDSTKAGEPAPSCFGGAYGTVWFRYDVPSDATLRVRVEGATLVTYEGAPGALHEVSCGAPLEPVAFRGGSTYYFMVATFFGLGPPRPGTFSLELASPPANDAIEEATIVGGLPFAVTQQDMADASHAGEPAPSCFGGAYGSVWFRYDAPRDALLQVRASVMYEGSPGALHELACGSQLAMPVTVRGGTTYYFMAISFFGLGPPAPVTFRIDEQVALDVPDPITAEAAGPTGTPIEFVVTASAPTGAPPAVACSPVSGSEFPIGETTVVCTASNEAGQRLEGRFTVHVLDTTPPVLTAPDAVAADATAPSGATVTFGVAASDSADPTPTLTCSPPSDTRFPIGDTTVECTAADRSGNVTSASFMVHVRGAVEQLHALREVVDDLAVGQTVRRGLQRPLVAANNALIRNHTGKVCANLLIFRITVALHAGTALDRDTAGQLLADAKRIGEVVGCRL